MDRKVTFGVCRILCSAALETNLHALRNPLGDFLRTSISCRGFQWRRNDDDDDRVINLCAILSPATPTFHDVFQPTTNTADSFRLRGPEAQMIVGLIAFVVTGITCDPIKKNDNQGIGCYPCQGPGMGVECCELVEGFVEDDWWSILYAVHATPRVKSALGPRGSEVIPGLGFGSYRGSIFSRRLAVFALHRMGSTKGGSTLLQIVTRASRLCASHSRLFTNYSARVS
jgi:hypothetical protein